MVHPVLITPEADHQIRSIDEGLRANHPAAMGLLGQELAAAVDLLARAPDVGHPYRLAGLLGIRRVLLRATGYHLYYSREDGPVVVLTLWPASHGTAPHLE